MDTHKKCLDRFYDDFWWSSNPIWKKKRDFKCILSVAYIGVCFICIFVAPPLDRPAYRGTRIGHIKATGARELSFVTNLDKKKKLFKKKKKRLQQQQQQHVNQLIAKVAKETDGRVGGRVN